MGEDFEDSGLVGMGHRELQARLPAEFPCGIPPVLSSGLNRYLTEVLKPFLYGSPCGRSERAFILGMPPRLPAQWWPGR